MSHSLFLKSIYLSLLLLLSISVHAHMAGVTDTSIRVNQQQLTVVYTVPLDNLNGLGLKTAEAREQAARQSFGIKNQQEKNPEISSNTHYFPIGLEHIVLGYDHLLFLFALLLFPLGWRQLAI